jgi:NAD(P) transhydrogenase subunit beta
VLLAINLTYVVSAALFVVGLKLLGRPRTARTGNLLSGLGMLLAVVVTLLDRSIIDFRWIALGLAVGTLVGIFVARLVAMTAMPEMVALFNGFGGLASLLVGWVIYHMNPGIGTFQVVTILLSVLIGGVTFSGSLLAFGKLRGIVTGRPVLYRGQQAVNLFVLAAAVTAGVLLGLDPAAGYTWFLAAVGLSLLYGLFFVLPIGGADMPVVISLLNSFSGLAACAAGFVLLNNLLIVAGALVGASGIILSNIMCKAMNRSLGNVLFSGFGGATGAGTAVGGQVRAITAQDAYHVLEAARSVVVVPGYGLAVAQAQHVVRELAGELEANGAEVRYAIHPVAGRMPGHMNVLLAEANVPYDQLYEMEAINGMIAGVDVVLVIGANDVVNPAAREDRASPLFGMPIINVDQARTVFVLKRSMAPGFAGVDNPLFGKSNTRMLFGDARASLQALVAEFRSVAA